MAFTQEDLDAIDAALASGELRVQVGDQEITYRSFYELRDARQIVKQAIASESSGRLSPRFRAAVFND